MSDTWILQPSRGVSDIRSKRYIGFLLQMDGPLDEAIVQCDINGKIEITCGQWCHGHLLATCAARCQAGVTPPTQGEKLIVHILFASVSGSSQWLCRGRESKQNLQFHLPGQQTKQWGGEMKTIDCF